MGAKTEALDATPAEAPSVFVHGGRVLPSVTVDSYNEELRDDEGFVGDRASRRAFQAILADWRDRLKERGEDPFGDLPMEEISKSKLDKMLNAGDPVSAGLVHTVVEEFAGELATVVRRFLRLGSWKDTERIVIGGGMIGSRIGELAMGRTSIMLAADGIKIELAAIQNDPDEAGLIGAVHLAPSWVMAGHDAILAVDIGGTNVRVGVVELNSGKRGNVEEADVWKRQVWRHADDELPSGQTLNLESLAHDTRLLPDSFEGPPDRVADDLLAFFDHGAPGIPGIGGFIEPAADEDGVLLTESDAAVMALDVAALDADTELATGSEPHAPDAQILS